MVDGSNACSDVRKCLLGVWSKIEKNWGRGSLKTPNGVHSYTIEGQLLSSGVKRSNMEHRT
jgi:hypothetical protein